MIWNIYGHPSEPASPAADENATETAAGVQNEEELPPDPVVRLQADLDASKAESEQWRDRFLRKAAEFENFRKRTDKEKLDSSLLAKSSVMMEFLPIVDACERALESLNNAKVENTTIEQYREGVQLLYKQLNDTLSRLGVETVKAEGEQFDPHLHEALSREPNAELNENTITRVLRRGYLYHGRLLRPAQVIVSVRPQDSE
jgi:molecular chaperone GrpE